MHEQEHRAGFIQVHDAPPLPGLTFLRYRGGGDPQGMADVFNASREEDGWGFFLTSEGLRNEMENLANADPRRDVLLAELVYYRRDEESEDITSSRDESETMGRTGA